MTSRIPSSLHWLIDKRARLDAEIQKTERSLAKAKHLIDELSELKANLEAIDRTLSLHHIQVDVNLIKPVRSHYVRINLPYGELTRSILMCLRLYAGEGPVSTSQIVSFIAARHADLDAQQETRAQLSASVQKRINNLVRQGVIKRHHSPKTNTYGLWSLVATRE